MGYGYKTILELNGKEYDVMAYSYSFNEDIDENGDISSSVKGGYIYVSLADIPSDEILAWGVERNNYRTGIIKIVDMSQGSLIPEEEVTFEMAACVGMKLSYERDHANYFTALLTISAKNIRVGRGDNWLNKNWTL